MGEVYRGRDTRLDRDVALKILPPSVASDPDRLRRLELEARAASQINHPNVVAVYDVATVNGATAIVSELLDGETVGQRLARGRIPASQALRYAVQIAEGLAAAHRRGVIHRDLKPDNIFISSDGDRAKILDFGLAKAIEPAPSHDTESPTVPHLTLPGTVVGTVGYMSPEQVRGETLDQRSDIFSFGVVLFEMLSGQRAFRRDSAADTMSAIMNEEPPELSGEQPGLVAILRRCLAKNPDARYQSARDLAFQLEQLSSFTGPASTGSRAPARNWLFVAAAAIVALLLAAIIWQLSSRRAATPAVSRTNSIAVVPFFNVSRSPEAEYFSDGMTEELIGALSRVQGLRVVARTSSFAFKGKELDAREIAKQLGVDHLLEGSVRQTGNRLRVTAQLIDGANGYQVWSETYDREVLDVFVIQEEISREIADRLVSKSPSPAVERASAEEFAAYDLYLKANFLFNQALTESSKPMLERAISLYEQAIQRNPRYAAAYSGLANAYTHFELLDGEESEERHRKAAEAARKALQLDPNLAEAHVALGDVLFHHGNDVARAEREFKKAIELDPNLVQARNYYAYLLLREYRLDESIAQSRIAVSLSPLDPLAAHVLGEALIYSRRYPEAVAVFESAMKAGISREIFFGSLAAAHSMMGEHEKAVAEFTRGAAMRPPHPFTRMVHAWVYARAGRREEATKILNEVLSYPPKERMKACHSFGGTYIALGDNESALTWLKRGVDAGVVTWFEVKASPWFDPLRSDPRFDALIEQAAVKEKRTRR